jgi:hypothetical protein
VETSSQQGEMASRQGRNHNSPQGVTTSSEMLETFKSLKAKLMSIKEDKIKKFEEQ